MSSNSPPAKSDFVGGLNWHVPQPPPPVSEGFQLLVDARRGDKRAIERCQSLFGVRIKPPKKLKPAKSRTPALKKKRKR